VNWEYSCDPSRAKDVFIGKIQMDSKEAVSSAESSKGIDIQDYDLVVLGSGTGIKNCGVDNR
jgi:predicted naringenin-chalcone synthase